MYAHTADKQSSGYTMDYNTIRVMSSPYYFACTQRASKRSYTGGTSWTIAYCMTLIISSAPARPTEHTSNTSTHALCLNNTEKNMSIIYGGITMATNHNMKTSETVTITVDQYAALVRDSVLARATAEALINVQSYNLPEYLCCLYAITKNDNEVANNA